MNGIAGGAKSLLRIVAALLFLQHGGQKLLGWFGGFPGGHLDTLMLVAGSIELAGGETELTLPEQAHYLGHRDALKPALSVMENLSFWRDFLGGETGDAAESLMRVGIDHAAHLPAGFLSAGQRRRLSIARLLSVKRPIWLLDEPPPRSMSPDKRCSST